LEIAGTLLTASGLQGARYQLLQVAALLLGFAMLVAGSILLSVGIIRWAIWPLIERRDG
jgi:hypothetical protein